VPPVPHEHPDHQVDRDVQGAQSLVLPHVVTLVGVERGGPRAGGGAPTAPPPTPGAAGNFARTFSAARAKNSAWLLGSSEGVVGDTLLTFPLYIFRPGGNSWMVSRERPSHYNCDYAQN
jgi:hypothetical protein